MTGQFAEPGHESMISKALFIKAVQADKSLPALLCEHADRVEALEEKHFDESYLEFLDEQIRLSPRGPEWTEVLKRRRAALSDFSNVPLLSGMIRAGGFPFSVRVHPELGTVIHWEQHTLAEME